MLCIPRIHVLLYNFTFGVHQSLNQFKIESIQRNTFNKLTGGKKDSPIFRLEFLMTIHLPVHIGQGPCMGSLLSDLPMISRKSPQRAKVSYSPSYPSNEYLVPHPVFFYSVKQRLVPLIVRENLNKHRVYAWKILGIV